MEPPVALEKQVHLQHFAVVRAARGRAEETVTTAAQSPRALFAELGLAAHGGLDPSWLRVAINDAFCGWDDGLRDGDRVVFIAPVSGG